MAENATQSRVKTKQHEQEHLVTQESQEHLDLSRLDIWKRMMPQSVILDAMKEMPIFLPVRRYEGL